MSFEAASLDDIEIEMKKKREREYQAKQSARLDADRLKRQAEKEGGGEHRGELQKSIAAALNHQIQTLCKRFDFSRQEIYEVVIAGNSTMRDIFFKWDVQSIGQKPYKSLVENEYLDGQRPHTALTTGSRRLGLRVNPFARVYGLPIIASHVGGDTAAALVAKT